MKIITTLNDIRAHSPCTSGWAKLLKGLGKTEAGGEPLDLLKVLDINGLDDTLWCLRVNHDGWKAMLTLSVLFAREVEHLMEDQRSKDALSAVEAFIRGDATLEQLEAASRAASAAWAASEAASRAASEAASRAASRAASAAWAASAASRAASEAASWAASEAASRAASRAASAAWAASAASRAASWAASEAASRAASERQVSILREFLSTD